MTTYILAALGLLAIAAMYDLCRRLLASKERALLAAADVKAVNAALHAADATVLELSKRVFDLELEMRSRIARSDVNSKAIENLAKEWALQLETLKAERVTMIAGGNPLTRRSNFGG